MANVGVLTTLLRKGDQVFEDKLNHASLLDGGLHSGARFRRFLHGNTADLETKLSDAGGEKLVVVDGVFSMDGDTAPLPELARVCGRNSAWLMVDDMSEVQRTALLVGPAYFSLHLLSSLASRRSR